MHIENLSITNFRNYSAAEFKFSPGFNLIIGSNGQGKTNAIESIMFLADQSSHRTSNTKALIKSGEEWATIRARFLREDREALVEARLHRAKPSNYFLNKNAAQGKDIQRIVQAVLFAPEDLLIVRGDPSNRRKFIDDALAIRYPDAVTVLQEYSRIVRQKNSLLKTLKYESKNSPLYATLELWNNSLAEIGSQIIYYRRQLVRDIDPLLSASYDLISGKQSLSKVTIKESHLPEANVSRETSNSFSAPDLSYVSRETILEELKRVVEQNIATEIDKSQSLYGPHRDDLDFFLNELPVKGYASHGETWSFVLGLKMALAKIVSSESYSGDPILVLDDVFAELDSGRRERLFGEVQKFEQVIVTAAVEEDVPVLAPHLTHRILSGEIVE